MQTCRIVLASRPHGAAAEGDFRLETTTLPDPGEGQILLHTIWLSLDPYMRGRMGDAPSYQPPLGIGEVMPAEVVSRVVVSRSPYCREGDLVRAHTGWQEHAVIDAKAVRGLPDTRQPPSTALGVLGMTGMTAWAGLANIGRPRSSETVVVGAAAGPVGSLVGQIAMLRGAHAVGIAGGPEKCAYVRSLGFDECLDHRDPAMADQLAAACPSGIDVYWENIGGAVWEAAFPLLNPFARVPVCGLAAFPSTGMGPGPDRTAPLFRAVLVKRLRIEGFIVRDFASQENEFVTEVSDWLTNGKVKHREAVTEGLENAPHAFLSMLRGNHIGKTLVRLGAD